MRNIFVGYIVLRGLGNRVRKGPSYGNAVALASAAHAGTHLYFGVSPLLYALATSVKEERMSSTDITWRTASRGRKVKDIVAFVTLLVAVMVFLVYPVVLAPVVHSFKDGKWADGWTQVFRSKK